MCAMKSSPHPLQAPRPPVPRLPRALHQEEHGQHHEEEPLDPLRHLLDFTHVPVGRVEVSKSEVLRIRAQFTKLIGKLPEHL